jgi:AbrB family looped-hinge helix DNA binding protein
MANQNPALEYLTTTRIGEKGQLTVPKQFREDLGLEAGAPFAVLRMGNGLLLIPEQRRFEQLCEQIGSALTAAGISQSQMVEALPEVRDQIFQEHYGDIDATDPEQPTDTPPLIR